MQPTILKPNSIEYENLEIVADILESQSPHNARYEVEDIYFDYGQRWMWTTIVRYGYRECQILSPRQWNNIISADTDSEIYECVEDIKNGDYFADR